MILISILLILLFVLVAHLLILPLSKKRPVFIKDFEGSFFVFIFLALIAAVTHPVIYILSIAIGVFIYFSKCWIIFGVSVENIRSALDKAILASRATCVRLAFGYEVDGNLLIKVKRLSFKVCYIQYIGQINSKKSELTKEIFRKFIQNYYI